MKHSKHNLSIPQTFFAVACAILSNSGLVKAEQSFYFGNPGGAMEIPASALPSDLSQFSVECHIKMMALPANSVRLVSVWNGQAERGAFNLSMNASGQIVATICTTQGDIRSINSTNFRPDSLWHHIIMSFSLGTLSVTIDGKTAAKQTFMKGTLPARTDLPLVIGHLNSNSDLNQNYFEGFISDVAIWNKALDENSATKRFNQPLTGSEPGLAVCYPIRAKTPQTAITGIPSNAPEGKLTGASAQASWYEINNWNETSTSQRQFCFFRYDLSSPPQGVKENVTAGLPAINSGNRRIVVNNETQEAGVLWQESRTKRVYVTWVNNDFSGLRCVLLPTLENADLVAGTSANAGNLYYMMVESLPGNRPETVAAKGSVRMVRPNGEQVYEAQCDMSGKGFNYYTGGGRGNMAYHNESVSVLLPRTMYTGDPTGKAPHHQASVTATFSADLSTVKHFGNPSSHSFGNILASTSSKDAMGLELGDVFPRALQLHRFTREKRLTKIIFNYKANLITIEKDGKPLKVSHDANTYTQLGGVAEGENSYSVIFATDHSPAGLVLDFSRVGINNEPRNIAMLRVARNFDSISGGYDVNDKLMVPGIPFPTAPETGEFHVFTGQLCRQRNPGIIWLTDYGPGEAARAPHIIRRSDGSILVVWEKTSGGNSSLWGMLVHESGRKIAEPEKLADDLELDREDTIVRAGNRDCFLARDRKSNKLQLCCVLESITTDLPQWSGPNGWGPENPQYQIERRKVITLSMRKRLESISTVIDKIEQCESLTSLIASEPMSAADPLVARDAQNKLNELLKDPVVHREMEAAHRYQVITEAEGNARRNRSNSRKHDELTAVATAYRDHSNFYKDSRAGRKSAADFERLMKDLFSETDRKQNP